MEDYKELVEFLDKKFEKIDKKFESTDDKLDKFIEVFAMKEDLKELATKADLTEFKSEILEGQDKISQKLEPLCEEKPLADAQDKKKTKVLEIHNDALKSHKILSDTQVSKVDELQVF